MTIKKLISLASAMLLHLLIAAQTSYSNWLNGTLAPISTAHSCLSADGQQVIAGDIMVGADRQISLLLGES